MKLKKTLDTMFLKWLFVFAALCVLAFVVTEVTNLHGLFVVATLILLGFLLMVLHMRKVTIDIMAEELQKSERIKAEFISNLSHEFKTPMTAVEGFARLLRKKSLTPEQFNEYTEIIIKETARLSNLSTNLLRLSMLNQSGFQGEATSFYIDEQLRFTILLLERAWQEKELSFEIDMQEILYEGHEEMLSQVWINILQNTIKFSPQGGVVGVSLRLEKKQIVVRISDQGPGISEEHWPKVFDRFFTDANRNPEGVGLGLPIAKRIVELSHGEIGFTTQMGNTVFFVKLPVK
ncbi:MAG: HAMP domain-containing histidine kinase [Defluviitaleaceae bacterium]|nr:HAMP domain-containing histidine kinase [Defluviitaleaceae bacterium]